MSPLASYKRLFDLAGPGYVLVAFLGRLPLAMSQLGTLLLVSTATGSYGLGGLAAIDECACRGGGGCKN